MAVKLYQAGVDYAHELVKDGKIEKGSWSFSGADGDALLGPNGDDWTTYAKCHLGEDGSVSDKTKGRYKYPFAKKVGGEIKIFRRGVAAAHSRASQQGLSAISSACANLMQQMGESASAKQVCPDCGSDEVSAVPGKPGMMKCAECGATFAAKESIEPEQWRRLDAREQNRILCESGNRYELIESAVDVFKASGSGKSEAAGTNPRYEGVKVGQANKVNGNRRIYPEAVWAVQLERAKAKMAAGMMGGCLDHSYDPLKDAAIIWRGLEMMTAGDVRGDFESIVGHTCGADLQALIDAGRGIGFSTRGYGSAHFPTPEEKTKYGLKDGVDDGVVVINPDWELIAIDPVDNPSVVDAVMPGGTPPASKRDSTDQALNTETVDMKDLKELEAQHGAVFAQHLQVVEQAKKDAAQEATKPLADEIAGLKQELKDAEKKAIDAEAATKKATDEAAELKGKLEAQEAANKDLARRAEVTKALPALLKDDKYAAVIGAKIADKDGKGLIDSADFDVAKATAFIKEKTAEYDAVIGSKRTNPLHAITGIDPVEPKPGQDEEVEAVRRELRLA